MRKHVDELRGMVDRLCPSALLDPLSPGFCVGAAGLSRFAHGVIGLSEHPYGHCKLAVLAGGVTGPTTAGAISLLSGRQILDPYKDSFSGLESRPLGGLFRRKAPMRQPPDDVLQIEDDLEWVTPPYDMNLLLEKLHAMSNAASRPDVLTHEDVERMIELVGRFDELVLGRAGKRLTSRFHVMIPIGGRGTRMKAYTKQQISKVELPILPAKGNAKSLSQETVLGVLVATLASTRMVEDVLLLTRDEFLAPHRQLGQELADRFKLSIFVESDGNDRYIDSLVKRLTKYSQKTRPCVLMMGDTLVSPTNLKGFLTWAAKKKPLLALACAEVSAGEVSRYGMLDVDQEDRVYRVVEKPGKASQRLAFQGLQVFFPYLRWDRLLADSGANHLLGLVSSAINQGLPVSAYRLNGPIYDCGSPEGYERACEDARQGGLW